MSTNRHAHSPLAAHRCWPSGFTDEPPIGAHLVTPRDRYTHHGIYVGDGKVIHYAGFSRPGHAGPVEEVNVIEFAFGHLLRVVAHTHARYSAQQIVQRARSRLGEHAFHLLRNNCEHFCNWCISGHHRSAQVERFRTVASLILRSKIAKWPDHVPEKGETDSGVRPSVYGAVTHQAAQTASRSFRTPRPQGGA